MVINGAAATNIALQTVANSKVTLTESLARLAPNSNYGTSRYDAGAAAVSVMSQANVRQYDAVSAGLNNATSYAQTRDTYLAKVEKALTQMSELATKAQDTSISAEDRAKLEKEYRSMGDYVTSVAGKDFNGVSLFNGKSQTVAGYAPPRTVEVTGIDLGAEAYKNATSSGVSSADSARAAAESLKVALEKLKADRETSAGSLARLGRANEELMVVRTTIMSANSPGASVDMALEWAASARQNILAQGNTAIQTQANYSPQMMQQLMR